MGNVKVSVLVVVFNAPECVPRAIDSVLAQSYRNLEILLLDDNSTDPGIAPLLAQYQERDKRVTCVRFATTDEDRRELCTYAANINWGAEHSTGSVLTFLAGDDYYAPDRIERMLAKLAEGHDVVYGSQDRPNANGRFIAPLATDVLTRARNRVDMSSVALTREAFYAAGGFDASFETWGDSDAAFWDRLNDAGFVFVPVDDPERFTDYKPYRDGSVQDRWNRGLEPWGN